MIPTANDMKTPNTVRITRRRPGRKSPAPLAWTVVLIAAGGLGAGEARAQLPDEPTAGAAPVYTATVHDLSVDAQQIHIPLNHSVLIETSKPSERVQAIDPSIVFVQSVSPTQLLVTGTGVGTSQVLTWSEAGQQKIFQIKVEIDLTALNEALDTVDPLSDVEAVPLLGTVVLTGTASSTAMADRLLGVAELFLPAGDAGTGGSIVQNHMTVAGEQQVLLRCTVAEISRSVSRQLGIDGFLAGENFRDAFVVSQIGGSNPIDIGAQVAADATQNLLFGTPGIPLQPTVPLSLGFPRVQLQVFLKALASNSLLRVLAEPNLVAISGEEASFLVGGEFPIPVPQGVDQITIEFREFGARLNFTPVVRGGQRIHLHIAPEVSELDFSSAVSIGGFSVPGLSQRRCETTVEIGNGQTIAIAGLLSDEVRGLATRIPGLGDVPVLGSLFRSVEYRRKVTELVILVTPELVAPLNPGQVPMVPGEDHLEPNDYQLYALGLLEGEVPVESGEVHYDSSADDQAMVESEPELTTVHGPWGHATEED
ncbi:MAG: type II and III secretion system protein family protein [bacterium]|nr:type II and III secretion system protein family protein [bacterium]